MTMNSRTSVIAPHAMVATSHPLAVQAGLDAMRIGGNAIDAAVAAVSVLGVVEPMSTSIGGDLFALVWHAESGQLYALNSSGPSAAASSIEAIKEKGFEKMPEDGIFAVSVPGATLGWEALIERFGTQPLSQILEPAIGYAQNGYPVSEIVASRWRQHADRLANDEAASSTFMPGGATPKAGELFRNPGLAKSLEAIADDGVDAYYNGHVADQIVKTSEKYGGFIKPEDLLDFKPTWEEPISTSYRDVEVFEHPPNTQGLIPLIAMNIAEGFDQASLEHNSAQYLHNLIESVKLAFPDGLAFTADPKFADIPYDALLSKDYAKSRRALISDQALGNIDPGYPEGGTVYVSAADSMGNVVSLIESIYFPFGSGVTAGDTGIMLQNRGALFSLDREHPNSLEPGKRPFHTILPAMAFRNNKPWMSFGMVGGFMQPQGHLQMICNLVDHGMTVQEAIEAPRFRFFEDKRVALEHGISDEVRMQLAAMGHEIVGGDQYFGGAQAIIIDPETGMFHGGSDPRKDGCAQGY